MRQLSTSSRHLHVQTIETKCCVTSLKLPDCCWRCSSFPERLPYRPGIAAGPPQSLRRGPFAGLSDQWSPEHSYQARRLVPASRSSLRNNRPRIPPSARVRKAAQEYEVSCLIRCGHCQPRSTLRAVNVDAESCVASADDWKLRGSREAISQTSEVGISERSERDERPAFAKATACQA